MRGSIGRACQSFKGGYMLIDSEKLKRSIEELKLQKGDDDRLLRGYDRGLKGCISIIETYEELERERLALERRG